MFRWLTSPRKPRPGRGPGARLTGCLLWTLGVIVVLAVVLVVLLLLFGGFQKGTNVGAPVSQVSGLRTG
jgi:hypothetical protein